MNDDDVKRTLRELRHGIAACMRRLNMLEEKAHVPTEPRTVQLLTIRVHELEELVLELKKTLDEVLLTQRLEAGRTDRIEGILSRKDLL